MEACHLACHCGIASIDAIESTPSPSHSQRRMKDGKRGNDIGNLRRQASWQAPFYRPLPGHWYHLVTVASHGRGLVGTCIHCRYGQSSIVLSRYSHIKVPLANGRGLQKRVQSPIQPCNVPRPRSKSKVALQRTREKLCTSPGLLVKKVSGGI